MFGRSVSLAFLFLALAPTQAHARTQNFLTGTPFGLGLVGGAENRPRTDFAAGTQTTSSNYASYFGVEPFFDLVNASFRLHLDWHFYPLASGEGSDVNGTFTENSDAGSFGYGARVQLAPFVGRAGRSRFYFVIGVENTVVKLRNARKYTSGAMAGQTNLEQLQGTGLEINGGLGLEFFLVQNWSLQLEGGYTDRSVNVFKYRTSTDVTRAEVSSGTTATNAAGNNKAFHAWTPYAQIALDLNL
jgi:hypothetical protein